MFDKLRNIISPKKQQEPKEIIVDGMPIANATPKQIIEQIHREFDTAEDRLLVQAEDLLKSLHIPTETAIEKKADRLSALGFTKTPSVKKAEELIQIRIERKGIIVNTKEQADLIKYYKQTYPFQKFLTEEELNRICKKYNLIYAPVVNYIKEVPEKNLNEIETAKPLIGSDALAKKLTVEITEYWDDAPKSLIDFLKDKEIIYTGYVTPKKEPAESQLKDAIVAMGYEGRFGKYIFSKASVKEVNKEGLFICAPPSHFDLTELEKDGELGYFKIRKWEIQDPIVFRYCKGGVQVLSKWGLEANDEALVNEINN